jgi:hypothetical protein
VNKLALLILVVLVGCIFVAQPQETKVTRMRESVGASMVVTPKPGVGLYSVRNSLFDNGLVKLEVLATHGPTGALAEWHVRIGQGSRNAKQELSRIMQATCYAAAEHDTASPRHMFWIADESFVWSEQPVIAAYLSAIPCEQAQLVQVRY